MSETNPSVGERWLRVFDQVAVRVETVFEDSRGQASHVEFQILRAPGCRATHTIEDFLALHVPDPERIYGQEAQRSTEGNEVNKEEIGPQPEKDPAGGRAVGSLGAKVRETEPKAGCGPLPIQEEQSVAAPSVRAQAAVQAARRRTGPAAGRRAKQEEWWQK